MTSQSLSESYFISNLSLAWTTEIQFFHDIFISLRIYLKFDAETQIWMLISIFDLKRVFGMISDSLAQKPIFSPRTATVQYCGGCSVLRGDSISTCGDSISTAEAVQYCGGIASVLREIASVLCRNSISTAEAVQYCEGIAAVHVGDNINTAEG